MHPIKYMWALRAAIYKPFFGRIGNLTYIGKPLFIEGCKNIYIGNKVRIFPGLRIQTLNNGKIIIGDNVAIEQNVQITSMGELIIGTDSVILGNTFITDLDHEYENICNSVLEQPLRYKKTEIGEGCFICYGASIQAGTILGKHCIVGTNSVVRGIYPDYSIIVGAPGHVIKKYNHDLKRWIKNNENQ